MGILLKSVPRGIQASRGDVLYLNRNRGCFSRKHSRADGSRNPLGSCGRPLIKAPNHSSLFETHTRRPDRSTGRISRLFSGSRSFKSECSAGPASRSLGARLLRHSSQSHSAEPTRCPKLQVRSHSQRDKSSPLPRQHQGSRALQLGLAGIRVPAMASHLISMPPHSCCLSGAWSAAD